MAGTDNQKWGIWDRLAGGWVAIATMAELSYKDAKGFADEWNVVKTMPPEDGDRYLPAPIIVHITDDSLRRQELEQELKRFYLPGGRYWEFPTVEAAILRRQVEAQRVKTMSDLLLQVLDKCVTVPDGWTFDEWDLFEQTAKAVLAVPAIFQPADDSRRRQETEQEPKRPILYGEWDLPEQAGRPS